MLESVNHEVATAFNLAESLIMRQTVLLFSCLSSLHLVRRHSGKRGILSVPTLISRASQSSSETSPLHEQCQGNNLLPDLDVIWDYCQGLATSSYPPPSNSVQQMDGDPFPQAALTFLRCLFARSGSFPSNSKLDTDKTNTYLLLVRNLLSFLDAKI